MAFNSSTTEEKEEYVTIKRQPHAEKSFFKFQYGDTGKVKVLENDEDNRNFIELSLKPMQFCDFRKDCQRNLKK